MHSMDVWFTVLDTTGSLRFLTVAMRVHFHRMQFCLKLRVKRTFFRD